MRVLVTGANRGLGLSLTKKGLENGHTVIANIRDENKISDGLKELKKQYDDKLDFIEMDVAEEDSVVAAAKELSSRYDSLDGIINNAAVLLGKEKVIDDLDMNELEYSFQVNTFGTMRVVKYLLPLIYKGQNQAIVNISSEAGTIINAFPTNYCYSMSKTAVNMFTERLRAYLQPKNICAYAVHPGWMQTDMGGEGALVDSMSTAASIYKILEGKMIIHSKIAFINCEGKPMPL